MKCLIDTNILLTPASDDQGLYPSMSNFIRNLKEFGYALCLTSQVYIEFWSCATRPRVSNELELNLNLTLVFAQEFLECFHLIPDIPEIFEHWLSLVSQKKVRGKQVHDARLVASIYAHGIEVIATSNARGFQRFDNLTVLNPQTLI